MSKVPGSSFSRPTQPVTCPYLYPSSTPIRALPHGLMTLSLGKLPQHNIDRKIAAVKHAKFDGIEVHMDCIINEAKVRLDSSSHYLACEARDC